MSIDIVRAVYEKYGGEDRGAICNEVAWRKNGNSANGRWGVSAKPSGANATQPRTGKKIAHDVVQDREADDFAEGGGIYDIMSDSGPQWGEGHPHGNPSGRPWLPAVQPLGVEPPPPDPPDPPPPPQPDYGWRIEAIENGLKSLMQQVAKLTNDLEESFGKIDVLTSDITELQQKPFTLPKLRAKSNGGWLGHSHDIEEVK